MIQTIMNRHATVCSRRKLLEDKEHGKGSIIISLIKIKLLFEDPKHMGDTI
jgi:hypothetical protein